MSLLEEGFYLISSPIGNLQDLTLRALEVLKNVDVIYCEDTRRTLKLLNAFEIRKPLKSCPHFREKQLLETIVERLKSRERVAYVCDAGTPGIQDPGGILVCGVRRGGFKVHLIGGVSALSYFLSGSGREWSSFRFVGFLPARKSERLRLFKEVIPEPLLFFESPHRLQSTLELLAQTKPEARLILAKELSKWAENFFEGKACELLSSISSFKGEWVGCIVSEKD